jgi:hypothetical protein
MGKYDPLLAHLRRQTSATYEMSFRDIERLLTAFLPHGAERAEWWSNELEPRSGPVQSRAWLEAGYCAFLVKGADRVRFERR